MPSCGLASARRCRITQENLQIDKENLEGRRNTERMEDGRNNSCTKKEDMANCKAV